jgi:hypothetical protein
MVRSHRRAAASLLFICVLWRFGWLESSGLTERGTLFAWALMLVVLAYDLLTTAYALFGSVGWFGLSDPNLSAAVATNALTTGLIGEIPFRGIVLVAFVQAWGNSREGLIKAVLASSLLFGGLHVIHILLGRPVPQAVLVAIAALLSGILYAALVLHGRTIWTAVVLHGVVNAVVAMRVLEAPAFAETVPALGLAIVLQSPLAILGAYLVYKLPEKPVVPDAGHPTATVRST